MNCDRLHELLDRHLAGGLSADERAAFDAHVAACGECRSVVEAVAGESAASIVQPVLRRTTGRICARVREEIAADDPWSATVRAHVDECADCTRFATVLARCDRTLPELAGVEADADFASDVVMTTVERPSLVHVAWRRAKDRFDRWLERPRAAQELAYAATIFLVLLTATPVSPFPGLPERLLGLARTPGGGIEAASLMEEGSVGDRMVEAAQERGGRIVRDLDRVGQGIATTSAGFLAGDSERVHRGAGQVSCGLQSLWLGVRAPREELDGPCADPSAAHGGDGTQTALGAVEGGQA